MKDGRSNPKGRLTLVTILFVTFMLTITGVLTLVTAAVPLGGHPGYTDKDAGSSSRASLLASRAGIPVSPPRIPNAKHGINPGVAGVVDPTSGYSAEPAPMGIGDFGVSSTGVAYTYGTSAFLGTFYWSSENIGGSGNAFTIQLNVVLKFVQGGQTYAYWIQDVAEPTNNGANGLEMSFIDNIWNFSGSWAMNSATLTGNGTINTYGSYNYYEVGASSSLPGATSTLSAPNYFQLLVRSYRATTGQPEVSFEYYDGVTNHFVTYDNVVFTFADAVTSDNGYTVDGTQYTGAGSPLAYDAELDMGGPGGGSSVAMDSLTNAHMTLFYFNGDNFESTPEAWNFGGDTGETISSVQSIGLWDKDGTLNDVELNGTTKDAAPGISYNPDQVGELNASATCPITGGDLAIGAQNWDFDGSWANVTLGPGTYHAWMNVTGGSDDLGLVTIKAAGFSRLSATSLCKPTVTIPMASPATVEVGEPVHFSTTASGGTGTFPTYTWTQSNSSFGCTLANSANITCIPTATGTSYNVSVTVTDSMGTTSPSETSAPYVVTSGPAATVPLPKPTSIDLGQSVNFTTNASGGSGTYTSYNWTQSSSSMGCTLSNSATILCKPTAVGTTYTVSVTVVDSVGGTSAKRTSSPLVVFSDPTVATPAPSPSTSEVGQSVVFNATASGGSGTYTTYTWTQSSSALGCTLANSASITCKPTAVGTTYTASVTVTDSNGVTSTMQTSSPLTVLAALALTTPMPSPLTVEAGQSVIFTTTASGGSGTYTTYTWTQSSSELGCALASMASISCTPTAAGTAYTVSVTVTDSNGFTSAKMTSAYFTVTPGPSITAFLVTPTSVPENGSALFNVTVQGGAAPYTYSYSGLPGCSSANTPSLSCVPTEMGNFTVVVTVTDRYNSATTASLLLHVTKSIPVSTGGGSLPLYLILLLLAIVVVAIVIVAVAVARRRRRRSAPAVPPPWQQPPYGYQAPPPWQGPPYQAPPPGQGYYPSPPGPYYPPSPPPG
jgi:hypothetical protein